MPLVVACSANVFLPTVHAMSVTLERVSAPTLGTRGRWRTLEQSFRFVGIGCEPLLELMWRVPLIGARSVFGERPGATALDEGGTRKVRGLSPAPTFRFDLSLQRIEPRAILVGLAQPDRSVAYLAGQLGWFLSDVEGGAMLEEQIDTACALEVAKQPLGGPQASLRRWLFFRAGHARVMDLAMGNIASLAT
jgi:hypothetical protein